MLSFRDPLPHSPRRVLILGVTGVGKSTLGRRLGEVWGLPYTNLDEMHWGPGWEARPEFRGDTEDLATGDQWITEWQYWGKGVKHVLGDRADTLVWLNFPRPIAWQRLFRRTVRRWLTREETFPGCMEPPLWKVLTDDGHILRWEARTHDFWRQRAPTVEREFPHATLVELRSPREVRHWVAAQTSDPGH